MLSKIKEKLGMNRYARDERIDAQMGRIYRIGFWILFFVILFDLYLQFVASQYAMSTDGFEGLFTTRPVELAALLSSAAVVTFLEIRAGIFDENPRYNECDSFPAGYAAVVSGIVAIVFAIATAAGRFCMEVIHEGIGNATWAGDIAMGIVFGMMAFGVGMLVMYLNYRSAKKRRQRILEEFDAE